MIALLPVFLMLAAAPLGLVSPAASDSMPASSATAPVAVYVPAHRLKSYSGVYLVTPPPPPGLAPGTKMLNLGPPGPDPYVIPWPKGSDGKILTGTTELMVLVSSDGRPVDIRVEKSSGYRALDAATIEATKRWRFEPAKRNGVPTEGYVRIPFSIGVSP